MLPDFSLTRPATIEEAVALLSDDSLSYAGGTELLMAMRMGLLQPERLIDLKRIPALQQIELTANELVLGASVTHYQVSRHPLVREHMPLLADVEDRVGNARVRASGTLGGNLCFAEPKSDVATTLSALDARLTLVSPEGIRSVTVDEFIIGPYTTIREDNQLLTTIHIPLDANRRGVYLKYQTMERPTLGVAAVQTTDNGSDRTVIVIGAASDRPIRFEFEDIQAVQPDEIANAIEPIADLTGSVLYKRHLVSVYVKRALNQLQALDAN